ncbi:hypothetical protein [Planctomicrobium piriforme]|uniref:DUF2029 domain-containing protein n=1 Tax=Planctomicrobium piriforme TaxID=1576369 RepID=A0A1I3J076_9PLAN|nr:hypothetical protein [Planctomicrobium piriforme]SFI53475.1 hypothetical protein SAMN05421753_11012 [Planctomicrobium piriforme]
MELLLQGYEINRPTWFYLSSLLLIAVYFRFTRIISLRNVDLLLLLSASPGLIFVDSEIPSAQSVGHTWLFVAACLFLLRLFVDPFLSRRPYLGQNLNSQGMGFLCASAFAFLMTQAITSALPDGSQETVARGAEIINRTATDPPSPDEVPSSGPTAPLLASLSLLMFQELAARVMAIVAHAAVIIGLWFVGRNLFADRNLGLAMATLYLLLPCTAYNVGEFNHVLPAALIVWAFVCFRKPIASGVLLGLACGTLTFPVVLLPIWAVFYGRRGAGKFALALSCVAVVLIGSFAMTSTDSESFVQKTVGSVNVALSALSGVQNHTGFWGEMGYLSVYRLPVMVAYFIMLTIMTIWPKDRTVEVLLAQSTAAIVGTQLWYTPEGGVYVLWYLPLMLMVVFRPRLIHLRAPSFPEHNAEAGNVSPGKPRQPSFGARPGSTRNVQLFR